MTAAPDVRAMVEDHIWCKIEDLVYCAPGLIDTDVKQNKQWNLVVTCSHLYVFEAKVKTGKKKAPARYSLLSLKKIDLKNGADGKKGLVLEFEQDKVKVLSFISKETVTGAKAPIEIAAEKILWVLQVLYFGRDEALRQLFSRIIAAGWSFPYTPLKNRPLNVMRWRFCANAKDRVPEKWDEDQMKIWGDSKGDTKEMKFVEKVPLGSENWMAAATAIGMDNGLESLTLNKFCCGNVAGFLSRLMTMSTSIKTLELMNYSVPADMVIAITNESMIPLKKLVLTKVDINFVKSFCIGLKSFKGRITSLKVQDCDLGLVGLDTIFETVTTHACFFQLTELELKGLKYGKFDVERLKNMLKTRDTLTDVSWTFCDGEEEGMNLIEPIVTCGSGIKHVSVIGSRLTVEPGRNFEIPERVTSLDVSSSRCVPRIFMEFLRCVTKTPRKAPLFFNASGLKGDGGTYTEHFLGPILANSEAIKSSIWELNWSKNKLTPQGMKMLLAFAKTQTNMRFLNVSETITTDGSPEECLSLLSEYVHQETLLEGIDIQSGTSCRLGPYLRKFLDDLAGAHGLRSFRIKGAKMNDSDVPDVIMKFVTACPDLSELMIDDIGIKTTQDFLRLYQWLLHNAKIRALGQPKVELDGLGFPAGKRLPPEIKNAMNGFKEKGMVKSALRRLRFAEESGFIAGGEDNQEDVPLEAILALIESSGMDKAASAANQRSRPLDRLNEVMKKMIAGDYPALATAELVIRHLETSRRHLGKPQ